MWVGDTGIISGVEKPRQFIELLTCDSLGPACVVGIDYSIWLESSIPTITGFDQSPVEESGPDRAIGPVGSTAPVPRAVEACMQFISNYIFDLV
ncbi:hypothetical protein Nepgr_003318 [Nepenthes gracilis]|uniref:Uncharacterized protein n=1 Tax=Nepenthes gracilis TaxID=150966 RepID=A0AAD3RZ93_NEPGR|nr:hypothetical protein Nepgr_003318 [Nepenthes gracilis]